MVPRDKVHLWAMGTFPRSLEYSFRAPVTLARHWKELDIPTGTAELKSSRAMAGTKVNF